MGSHKYLKAGGRMSPDQNGPGTQYVFLLGAGASKKAGVPLVDEMTQAFETQIGKMASMYPIRLDESSVDLDTLVLGALAALKKLVISAGRKFDVEVLLEALTKLTDTNEIMHILRPKPDEYSEVYTPLKVMLIHFIRETCEKVGDVDYLYPLKGFVSEKGLDIFTLNYDGTVEAVCEKFDIPYSDGFSPNWNPSQLETEKAEIRLYKIHGSLFWFKTGKSKYIKLPIKGIEPERLRYFTDEGISETIIYPLLSKEVYTGPFPWLMQKFRNNLAETELCVVIGYSFRDDSIRKVIFEQMENNPRLWLYLINPRADETKRSILDLHGDFFDRIVTLELKAEDALKERVLVENLNSLKAARQQEAEAKRGLLQSSMLYSDSWQGCIFNYKQIKHLDRIRSAIEEIMKYVKIN